jgi:hypothetical protein
MTDSSSPATAFAAHVKLIIANCNQNGAPDEVRFVGAMPAHGSGAHFNQRVTQRPCRPIPSMPDDSARAYPKRAEGST